MTYYGTIHVPVKEFTQVESHYHYWEVMINVLEQAMYHAIERHLHRVDWMQCGPEICHGVLLRKR